MINWEGTKFILDAGPGTMTEIWRRRLRLRGLSAILLSHGHLDHTWGLAPLLWFLHQRNWKQKLQIIYPSGIEKTVQQLVALSGDPEFIIFQPVSSQSQPIRIKKITVKPFSVNHPSPSSGFILTEPSKPRLDTAKLTAIGLPKSHWATLAKGSPVEYDGKKYVPTDFICKPCPRKIVYTGDTGPSPSLTDSVKDADLVIIDASWVLPHWEPPEEAPHLTLRQAFEIVRQAQVSHVLLTHLTTRVSLDVYRKAVADLQKEFCSTISVHFPNQEKLELE